MTYANQSAKPPLLSGTLLKPMAICAGIAVGIMTLFLVTVGKGKPEFPPFWQIRPLAVMLFAGAAGGAFYHFIDRKQLKGGWKFAGIVLSLIVIFIGMWMGSVLGLAGTYWH